MPGAAGGDLNRLPQRITDILKTLGGQGPKTSGRVLVAYSGGLDSTVLLHALSTQLAPRPVMAVHINHGLQPEADQWDAHCQSFCEALGIELVVQQVEVPQQAELGLEAAARKARYQALQSLMTDGDLLLTAHHQQDQAETVLLQLLRGTGVAGIAAMPTIKPFGPGWQLRPLLDVDQTALREYARHAALQWVDDPSNATLEQDRNYLRQQVLPVLAKRWPGFPTTLSRAATNAQETASLIHDLAKQDLTGCQGQQPGCLSVAALSKLRAERRRNLLRYWICEHGFQSPQRIQLQQLESDLLTAREDAAPRITLGNAEFRRYRDDLYLMQPLPAAPGDMQIDWNLKGEVILPQGCGTLRAIPQSGEYPADAEPGYRIGFIQGGERIQLTNRTHHHRLKHWLQEAAVPPWVRRRMPLIYHGDQLAAVADCWIEANQQGEGAHQAIALQWLDAPPGWQGLSRLN